MALKKRILIVEDHPSIRAMLVSLFSHGGFEVVEAQDGEAGLLLAKQGGFGAILLDLKMPQMDGLEVLEKIQLMNPKPDNGPVIVYSSVDYPFAQEEAKRRGAAAFIPKDDLQSQDLVNKVLKLMAG